MYLGIDLGTSNSAIAVHLDGELRILKTVDKGTDVLPSAIYIDKRGHKFYGHRAYEHLFRNPVNAVDGFKRQMGTSWKKEFADSGEVMSAEECSANILRQLVAQARVECGERDITGTVITTPAAFNQMQIEATRRAANMAGLERVALLQEPVAAAMAAVAGSKNKDGIFLVYDIGGGTFDLALVQSVGGNISIVAHEGINALGGRDFDRIIINSIVRPWLLENFSLPPDFQQKEKKYEKMIRVARMAAEMAKIELSKNKDTKIYLSDDELRVTDDDGADIFIEIDITRKQYEKLISDKIEDSVILSRKVLQDNGYESGDLDRLVFIGGPSKTPVLREKIAHELGLPADISSDPMTAVALGAAIFCEGLNWKDEKATRKKTRERTQIGGNVNIQYDYKNRTAEDRTRIRIKSQDDSIDGNFEIQIDSTEGWTSGRHDLDDGLTIELPLDKNGENYFRVLVFGKNGELIKETERTIVITRLAAAADSLKLTHNLAVIILTGENDEAKNELHPFAEKGIDLPAEGIAETFLAARDMRSDNDKICVQFYEQPQVNNLTPGEPNLFIGICEINRKHLSTDVHKGDEINIHWQVDESGLMEFKVELGGEIFGGKYYSSIAGQRSYEGASGEQFVSEMLKDAKSELAKAEDTSASGDFPEIRKLKNSLDEQGHGLQNANDGEERRGIAEKTRDIRQKIAAIRNNPQNRVANLKTELEDMCQNFNRDCRKEADNHVSERFDELAEQAHENLKEGDSGFDDAKRCVKEMGGIYYRVLYASPGFIVAMFKYVSEKKNTAIDTDKHCRLVETGTEMFTDNDIEGLKRIVGELFANQINAGKSPADISKFSDIMRR